MTPVLTGGARSVADLTAGVILASVEIAAPPERVFRALTDPAELMKWWGSPDTYRTYEWTADLRVGGKWRARGQGAGGRAFSVGGEFRVVDPPHLLVQTWAPDWEDGLVTTITYRLTPIAGGTRLTLKHEGFGERRQACEDHGRGWERVLGWLSDHVSGARQEGRPARGFAARFFNPLRLAAYVLVLYALGHTRGALWATPSFGSQSDAAVALMRSVHFQCETSTCTWFGFYLGFGYMVSVFFLVSAALAWFLGGADAAAQRASRPLVWTLFLGHVAGAILAWAYFFAVPGIFATVVAALLGFAALRQTKFAPARA